ncbi:MAG: PIG-L family deacetylase [Gammaproteobacteria bacterium]|nr:PIG-L family deacetylase [Gammaproteobacteria bacterium]
MRILVVAPHPDDEVLGCGATMAKMASLGHEVFVVIVTKAGPPLFSESFVQQGRDEAKIAHHLLGVKETFFCNLPAAALDGVPHCEINAVLNEKFKEIRPDIVFIPFVSDLHLDHQHVFLSALVAARPNQTHYPHKILAYETLSETNWNASYVTAGFQPNFFVDVTDFLQLKLKAFAAYQSQLKSFPHERSLEALEALARVRGASVCRKAAEAFVLIREVMN